MLPFRLCMPHALVGMGVAWQGIPATEIRAALLLSRAPRADWPRLADDLAYMGRIVADTRNRLSTVAA